MIAWLKSSSGVFVAGLIIGGLLVMRLLRPVSVKEQMHEVSHVAETAKTITRTVTRVKKPDGTVKTVVKNEIKKDQVTEKIDDKYTSSESKPHYSLGVNYLPSLTHVASPYDSEIVGGVRLGETNLWLKSGFDIKYRQLKFGLEYQF